MHGPAQPLTEVHGANLSRTPNFLSKHNVGISEENLGDLSFSAWANHLPLQASACSSVGWVSQVTTSVVSFEDPSLHFIQSSWEHSLT